MCAKYVECRSARRKEYRRAHAAEIAAYNKDYWKRYWASPLGSRLQLRRWRRALQEGMARKEDLIRQLEAQLRSPQEVSAHG